MVRLVFQVDLHQSALTRVALGRRPVVLPVAVAEILQSRASRCLLDRIGVS